MTLPNWLSCLRLLMVPVFGVLYFSDWPDARPLAAGVYVLAWMTDALDGMLARRLGQITKLGRLLDPLADKLMSACVILCFALSGRAPWWVTILFFLKEMLLGLGALLLYRKTADIPSSLFLGKFTTVLFFVVCLVILLAPVGYKAASFLLGGAVALNLVALVYYGICYLYKPRSP